MASVENGSSASDDGQTDQQYTPMIHRTNHKRNDNKVSIKI